MYLNKTDIIEKQKSQPETAMVAMSGCAASQNEKLNASALATHSAAPKYSGTVIVLSHLA